MATNINMERARSISLVNNVQGGLIIVWEDAFLSQHPALLLFLGCAEFPDDEQCLVPDGRRQLNVARLQTLHPVRHFLR